MQKELTTPIQSWAQSASAPLWLRSAGIVVVGSGLVAACAHLALPLWFSPVPLTLQTFAVLLLGLLLPPRLAAATLLAYLAEGAAGLPFFAPSPATGGLAHLLGPTGGYLLAYPAAALLTSWLARRGQRKFTRSLVSAFVGSLVILACGSLWLATLTHAPLRSIFTLAVLPFLPGDALKVAAAATASAAIQRLRRKAADSHPTL